MWTVAHYLVNQFNRLGPCAFDQIVTQGDDDAGEVEC